MTVQVGTRSQIRVVARERRLGTVVRNAGVVVTNVGTGGAATVYSDEDLTTPITSLVTDGSGVFSFYAPPGTYSISFTGSDAFEAVENVHVVGDDTSPTGTYAPTAALVLVSQASGGDDAATLNAALSGASSGSKVLLSAGQTYLVNSVVTKPLGVSLDLNGSVIKANAAIAGPVVDTQTSAADSGTIRNGIIDCNLNAQNGLYCRRFGHLTIADVEVWNSTQHGVILGDSTSGGTSFEAIVRGLRIWRAQANTPPVGYHGLWVTSFCSDSEFTQVVVVGAETSFRNDGGDNKFSHCHGWGYSGKNPITVFDDNGSGTDWIACTADTPTTYGWRLRQFNTKIFGGKVYNGTFGGSDNVVVGVQCDQSGAYFTIIGIHFQGADGTHRIAKDINYTAGNGQQIIFGCGHDNVVSATHDRLDLRGSNALSMTGASGSILASTSSAFQFPNSTSLFGYSDNFSTQKWKLDSGGGNAILGGGITTALVSKVANYTAGPNDSVILANGTFTVTLPSAVTAGAGRRYAVKNTGSGTITVAATAGTVEITSLAAGVGHYYVSDGTNWYAMV